MNSNLHAMAASCAIAFAISGCVHEPSKRETPVATQAPLEQPALPAGYIKISPAPLDTAAQKLAQTAAIFRGKLKNVGFTYDSCGGPRTEYVFGSASTLAGVAMPADLTLKVLGGPIPSGSWVSVSEQPRLALDAEYVVFLRNTDWTYSPIVSDLVFRVEALGGREVLVNAQGRVLVAWNEDGAQFSAAAVSEPVGLQWKRIRHAPRPVESAGATSGSPSPRAVVEGSRATGEGVPSRLAPPDFAPSTEEIRASGMFARPRLTGALGANEHAATAQALVASVMSEAERQGLRIGGRFALEPYWKCWSTTPTHKH